MNSRRWLVWCLPLGILIVASFWGMNRETELRAAEVRIAAAIEANHRLVIALRKRDAQAGTVASPASVADKTARAGAADPAVAGNFARGARIQARLRAMPEYAPHERRELRRHTMQEYGDLFAQLNLPADKLEGLKRVLDENHGTALDAFNASYAQGYGQTSKEFQDTLSRYIAEGRERVRQFLGPEDYQRYEDYEKCAGWRNGQLMGIKSTMALRALPALTPQQEAMLARAYLATQNWQPAGPKPPYGVLFRMQNDQLGELARGALAPEQHAALVEYLRFVNERSALLGRLLHPQDPDKYVVSRSP